MPKLQAGGTGKMTVGGSGKMAGIPTGVKTPVSTSKMAVGGIVMGVPAYNEPMGRMAAPSGGGSSDSSGTDTPQEYVSTDTSSGFSWTWIIVALVAIVVLFFVFKKK